MEDMQDTRWAWRKLVWLAPTAMAAVFLVVMVVLAGGFELVLAIFGAILLITAYVGRRFPRRAGPITVLVVLALLLLMNLPALADDLGHPESFLNFAVFAILLLVLNLTGVIAAVASLMNRSGDGAVVVYAGAAVIVIGTIVSAVATASFESDTAQSGDLLVVAEEVEFSPVTLSGSGTIGVFIENKDRFRHTFTIEDLGVDVNLPGGADQRVDITGAPGTYEFMCEVPGHEDMKGTLTITG